MDNSALSSFPAVMSALRKERGLSQRRAAADMGISQALLSHYENGAREPGLAFVVRACDYYGVSADYMLGRTADSRRRGERMSRIRQFAAELRDMAKRAENYAEDAEA